MLLVPVTLGLGSLALWIWRRGFIWKVDEGGVQLFSGRRVPWSDVVSLHTRKSQANADSKVLRLHVQFKEGRGIILPSWLENGPEVVESVKAGMRGALPPDSQMRVHYVQRRA